jgi:PAS domain S-box-containing protein
MLNNFPKTAAKTDRRSDGIAALLSAIVNSSDDAIVSKTLDGIITSWNPAAQRMFGYTPQEAIDKSVRLIIPPELQAEEDYVLNEIRNGRKVEHFETVRQTKDGRRINVSLTVSPILNSRGKVIGASKIARDLTEKKQTEQEYEAVRQQLAQALAGRDEFIAVAAHELRNPLNVLALLWRVMDRTPGASSDRALIERSRAHLARLTSLVDRLLDVTRIRSGTFDLYREPCELNGLIRDVIEKFPIEHSQGRIVLELEPRIEGNWDRLRIDQAITNLVSNAIRFGAGKPVLINGRADEDRALLTVRDRGIGISLKDRERIFDRFERCGSRTNNHGSGLGMGLWITRQIVEAHGGAVEVESEPEQGSTFIVSLPLRARQVA